MQPTISLSFYLQLCLSLYLPIYLSLNVSLYLSISQCIYLSIYLPFFLYFYIFLSLSLPLTHTHVYTHTDIHKFFPQSFCLVAWLKGLGVENRQKGIFNFLRYLTFSLPKHTSMFQYSNITVFISFSIIFVLFAPFMCRRSFLVF